VKYTCISATTTRIAHEEATTTTSVCVPGWWENTKAGGNTRDECTECNPIAHAATATCTAISSKVEIDVLACSAVNNNAVALKSTADCNKVMTTANAQVGACTHALLPAAYTCTSADTSIFSAGKCEANYFRVVSTSAKADVCTLCPIGTDCDGTTTKIVCLAGSFAKMGDGDCTACAADEFSLPGTGVCQKKVTITFDGTCDRSNLNFFEAFRIKFQKMFAEEFKISLERVFLWEVSCPDGSMRTYGDTTTSPTKKTDSTKTDRRRLRALGDKGVKANFIMVPVDPKKTAQAGEPSPLAVIATLQKNEDDGKLAADLNMVIDGFKMKPASFVGVNKIGRETKDSAAYCHFCTGHKKMLDDVFLKALGGNINYDFSVIIDPNKPIALELYKKVKKNP